MTAGKKFSARRTAMVQFLEPITTADEEQTAGMEEGQARPVVEGQTTGKKLNTRRMVHHPVTTTIQTVTVAEEQTATVDKEPIRSGENTILQYIVIWWHVVQFLRIYVGIVAIVITAILFFIIGTYCLGRAVHK